MTVFKIKNFQFCVEEIICKVDIFSDAFFKLLVNQGLSICKVDMWDLRVHM